jgi:hypothetical protein
MVKLNKIFIFIACLLPLPALADLSASLDRRDAMVGETVVLTLETSDPKQRLDADFSVLADNFHVLGQQSESQVSVVNGQQTARVRLLVTLEPKRDGRLEIPAIAIDGQQTAPLVLNVRPAPQLAPGASEPVFIETEYQPQAGQIWVHSQVNLVIRLFYEFRLSEGSMSEPAPEHASLQLLNERPYQAQRNNTRYWVLERRYALFPERSGELVIPAVEFTGRINERPAQGSLWNSNRGRRIRVEGETLTLSVKPKPTAYPDSPWLPARAFEVQQSITIPDGGLKVGEPVTRTVSMDVVGLDSSMLPELSWPELENARVYPDSPETITRNDGSWLTSRSQSRFAVVPEQAGELVLPELRIDWWDTVNARVQQAVIPAEVVTVLPGAITALATPAPAIGTAPAVPASSSGAASVIREVSDAGSWPAITALFAVLWLLTLLAWLKGRAVTKDVQSAGPESPDQAQLLTALQRACRKGDAREAANLLSLWVRHEQDAITEPGINGLAQVIDDHELREQLIELDKARWASSEHASWNGKALWAGFERWRKKRLAAHRGTSKKTLSLPALYAK